jgi:hypothetical protein
LETCIKVHHLCMFLHVLYQDEDGAKGIRGVL